MTKVVSKELHDLVPGAADSACSIKSMLLTILPVSMCPLQCGVCGRSQRRDV